MPISSRIWVSQRMGMGGPACRCRGRRESARGGLLPRGAWLPRRYPFFLVRQLRTAVKGARFTAALARRPGTTRVPLAPPIDARGDVNHHNDVDSVYTPYLVFVNVDF